MYCPRIAYYVQIIAGHLVIYLSKKFNVYTYLCKEFYIIVQI